MKTGWTGGQYSLVRSTYAHVIAALLLLWAFLLWDKGGSTLRLAALLGGAALCIPLAFGFWDRLAGLLVGAALVVGIRGGLTDWQYLFPVVEALALFHACTPPAPYGSWAARGRADPDGGWGLGSVRAWAARGLVLGAVVFAFLHPALTWHPELLLLLPLVVGPGWFPPKGDGHIRIFYDGTCALCHRGVRFLLAEDRRERMRFAPLQGPTFEAALGAETRATLPDSIVVLTSDGGAHVKSEAVLQVAAALGGYWRLGACLYRLIPRFVRDWGYERVAKRRRRVFGSTTGSCPLIPEGMRVRFDP